MISYAMHDAAHTGNGGPLIAGRCLAVGVRLDGQRRTRRILRTLVIFMMNGKQGMELSINMIVVVVLGIVVLGMGIAIFNQGFSKAVELKDDVSQQTKVQLNRLLDDGSLIVVPFANKEGKRGDPVYFDVAIANELGVVDDLWFSMTVNFAAVEFTSDIDPQLAADIQTALQTGNLGDGHVWVLHVNKGEAFVIKNNERAYIPLAFDVPRKIATANGDTGVPKGQYVFNIDVCRSIDQKPTAAGDGVFSADEAACEPDFSNRHHTRQKLYINLR